MKIPVIWTLAIRNLREHGRRSITVGLIMAFGLFLYLFGNAFLDSATKGVEESYIGKFTGNMFLSMPNKETMTVFGADGRSFDIKISAFSDYPKLEKVVADSGLFETWNPHSISFTQILVEEQARTAVRMLGIEPTNYTKMFPNTVVFLEGGFWAEGQRGIVLNESTVRILREKSSKNIQVGDTLDLAMMGQAGNIRSVKLTGIARLDEAMKQGPHSLTAWVDIDTVRLLVGHVIESNAATTAQASPTTLNEEDLFSDAPAVAETGPKVDLGDLLKSGLGQRSAAVTDTNAWQFVTLKLKPGITADTAIPALKGALKQADLDVNVGDWVAGAGSTAQTVLALKMAFGIVVFIIILVAIFIVMNALMISISERTTEIGTMRALGARKVLVRNLILLEVFFLSLVAGVVGVIFSIAVVATFYFTGIPIDSGFLQLLFASEMVRPFMTVGGTIQGWIGLLVVGLMAGWYPANTALKLSPLKAIQAD